MKKYEITLIALSQRNNYCMIKFDVLANDEKEVSEKALSNYHGSVVDDWKKRKHDIEVFHIREIKE